MYAGFGGTALLSAPSAGLSAAVVGIAGQAGQAVTPIANRACIDPMSVSPAVVAVVALAVVALADFGLPFPVVIAAPNRMARRPPDPRADPPGRGVWRMTGPRACRSA